MMKSQILETLGFGPKEQFPVYVDRFPNQLLAYLRLSRVADPALFAKVRHARAPPHTRPLKYSTARTFISIGIYVRPFEACSSFCVPTLCVCVCAFMCNRCLLTLRADCVCLSLLLAQVSFEQDVELSQMNEYEILQLLMGDCREKLQAYSQNYEEDVKMAQVGGVGA